MYKNFSKLFRFQFFKDLKILLILLHLSTYFDGVGMSVPGTA